MKLGFKVSHVLAFAVVALTGLWMFSGSVVVSGQGPTAAGMADQAAEAAEAQAQAAYPVRVQTFLIEERRVSLDVRGASQAEARVGIAAETAGRVVNLDVREGQRVKAGDVLCRIDQGARPAQLMQAEALVAQAQLDFDGASTLGQSGFASETRVKGARAALDAANAQLAQVQLDLDRTAIRAPFGGLVEAPLADIGAMLPPGGLCATLVDDDPMLFIGQVSEREISSLRPGMEAHVTLTTGETINGTIRFLSALADEATRTFHIEIALPNPDGRLKSGVTARAAIDLPSMQAHFLPPSILTLHDDGRIGVRMVDKDDRVVFQEVAILADSREGVWVAGLPPVAPVIIVGQDYVKAGEIVVPDPQEANQ